MKIYVIDNYDSFVYNIVHMLKALNVDTIEVVKNDKIDFNAISNFDKIVLSPGPGIPKEAGDMMEVIHRFHSTHSILGVCLGHQAIGEYFGWDLQQLAKPLHGIASEMNIENNETLFQGVNSGNLIGHYHSWVVAPKENSLLKAIAWDKNDNVMALQHLQYKVFGLQFHPESVLTENGKTILNNWLQL